ncbi:Unknown protein [Striga hermonthica]|uniref:Uncharacterized protein n=1 Tax=Striga hermonthica TaxID=68872 RepID=A0A9N7RQM4_STRHE|nr:Unknown protein [Striga hermonthica]
MCPLDVYKFHGHKNSPISMLQFLFTAAFAAAPLMLYIPPVRSLNSFLQTAEILFSGAISYGLVVCPILRDVVSIFRQPRFTIARS